MNRSIRRFPHEPTNSVVASVKYSFGLPDNLERINFDGTRTQFSALAGATEELKIATARSGGGSFAAGTLFTGNGSAGEIVRISPDRTWSASPP